MNAVHHDGTDRTRLLTNACARGYYFVVSETDGWVRVLQVPPDVVIWLN
ncbi:MAG: hypothetical protein AABY75_05350 [Bacteroidota bacterium]